MKTDLIVIGIGVALAVIASYSAWAVLRIRLTRAKTLLFRTNFRGIEVPVVLGDALVGGALCGTAFLLVIAFWVGGRCCLNVPAAVAIPLVLMWAAGRWDDRRGDERPRGFKGHLGAIRSRSITGGLVKIGAAVVTGLLVAPFVATNGAAPLAHLVETVALVGLSANLINLFDRAPGRAGKIALVIGVPLMLVGGSDWRLASVSVLGALIACLSWDLKEIGMLGDAGANPLGAVLGVGLAWSLPEPGRIVAISILLALNLASEKWSFSRAIEATPPLRWFDGLGRKDQVAAK